MADLAGFRDRFPEFSAISDARVELFLDDAALQINIGAWGLKADLGIYWLTAHMLALDTAAGTTGGTYGPVTSESVGQVSRSYASGGSYSGTSSEYGATKYGVNYYRLWRTIIATPVVL
jgi:hypothetical protein